MMSEACQKKKRRLYAWEIKEVRSIFSITLDYDRVRIHECTPWPDRIDRIGRWLKRMPPPGEHDHNAITLGNHCFFPVALPELLPPVGDRESYKVDWLVHELTHVWQYQQYGWKYLWLALRAQLRDKEKAYDFGGEQGLLQSRQQNIVFKQFNPEQQGNIVQSYYVRKRANLDVSAWEPYIEDVKKLI